MAAQMVEILEMVESVETNIENICTLATSINVPKDILVNLNATKLNLDDCKKSLVTHGQQEYNLDLLEKKHSAKLNEKNDVKPIKVEAMSLVEDKPDVLNDMTKPLILPVSPKRFDEILEFGEDDFDYLGYGNEFDDTGHDIDDEGRDTQSGICGVCGGPASDNSYYGAVCCFSCRAFFRRGQPKYCCIYNTDECEITVKTRIRCKSCRYNKCIQIGMIPENTETKKSRTAVDKKETGIKREKQKMEDGDYAEPVKKKSKLSSSNKKDTEFSEECRVCGNPASTHLNYGAITCNSCRAFFRRGRPKNKRCINNSRCKITKATKAGCPYCRYNKCLAIGMVPALVKNRNPDDVAVLDYPIEYDVGFNDNSDDDVNNEHEPKGEEIEKPEEPTTQAKAETFVEFMKTVKKNEDFIVEEVAAALQSENYHFFSNMKEKDGEVMKQCSICKDSKKLVSDPNHIKNHFNFYPCRTCGLWLLQFQAPHHKREKHLQQCRVCFHFYRDVLNHNCPVRDFPCGLKCEFCGESFKKANYLHKHKRRKHSNKKFVCDICGRTDFKHVDAYRNHVKTHTDQTFTCKLCQAQFKSIWELKKHQREEHLDVLGQFCDVCMIVVPSLKTHNRFKHAPVNCEICGKEFSNNNNLTRHIQTTHDKKFVVQCEVCNKEFSQKKSLANHMKKVHKINIRIKEIPLKIEQMANS